MKTWGKVAIGIIVILMVLSLFTNVLFLALDTSESQEEPGADMAALWSVQGGFRWIYPGSTTDASGNTLHNIYLFEDHNPMAHAKEMIEHTYNIHPTLCVTINNEASNRIFGDNLINNIREENWGEGNDRGDAVGMSVSSSPPNPIGIIISLFTGDLRIFPI